MSTRRNENTDEERLEVEIHCLIKSASDDDPFDNFDGVWKQAVIKPIEAMDFKVDVISLNISVSRGEYSAAIIAKDLAAQKTFDIAYAHSVNSPDLALSPSEFRVWAGLSTKYASRKSSESIRKIYASLSVAGKALRTPVEEEPALNEGGHVAGEAASETAQTADEVSVDQKNEPALFEDISAKFGTVKFSGQKRIALSRAFCDNLHIDFSDLEVIYQVTMRGAQTPALSLASEVLLAARISKAMNNFEELAKRNDLFSSE